MNLHRLSSNCRTWSALARIKTLVNVPKNGRPFELFSQELITALRGRPMIQDDVTYSTRIDLVDLHHHLRISEESRFLVRTRVANLVNPSSKFTPTQSTFLTKLHSTFNINIYITHNSKCTQLKSLYLSLSEADAIWNRNSNSFPTLTWELFSEHLEADSKHSL